MIQPLKLTKLEKTRSYPFCMVYLFTKQGIKLLSGSMDKIELHTEEWPVCHGIIHYYLRDRISKSWRLFGRASELHLRRVKVTPDAPAYCDYVPSGTLLRTVVKRTGWVLVNKHTGSLIAKWRKLPSRFLKQLEPWQ